MHKAIVKEMKIFQSKNKSFMKSAKIAELGSYNINGTIRKYLPKLKGFDIYKGDCVDVVIRPGIIPQEHIGKYNFVVSCNSFQYCPEPKLYKKEIIDLLKTGGMVWFNMCAPSCKRKHNTSDNKYKYKDSFRMSRKNLKAFFEPEITCVLCYQKTRFGHKDIIFIGKKGE